MVNNHLNVDYGDELKKRLKFYPKEMRELVLDFAEHVSENGFNGLPGRNKSSDDVSTENHNFISDVKYAQEHNLWHYHLGYPQYSKENPVGDYTSQFYLHYQLSAEGITLIKIYN
jgi:hypothetical protein